MRILGIDIPDNLRLEYALQRIYGVGKTNVHEILDKAELDENMRAKELTDEQIAKIQRALDNYVTQGNLRRQVNQDIQRLIAISSYRGRRHQASLPVKGQRTKTNARTKRGKRVTVGAFKKSKLNG